MFLKVQLSWAEDEAEALKGAMEQWAPNIFASSVLTDLRRPEQFQELAKTVQPRDLEGLVRVSSSLQRHVDWLAEDVRLGFSHLYLHNVNRGQDAFIRAFAEKVLPALRAV
jgi:hypothetical protein